MIVFGQLGGSSVPRSRAPDRATVLENYSAGYLKASSKSVSTLLEYNTRSPSRPYNTVS